MSGPPGRRHPKGRRPDAAHCRSWQYRIDERPADRRAFHRPHHLRCAGCGVWRTAGHQIGRWAACRYCTHHPGADGAGAAPGDDWPFPAGRCAGKKGKRLSAGKYFLLLAALSCASPVLAERVPVAVRPTPRPALKSDAPAEPPEPPIDLSHAMPSESLKNLPSSQQQLGTLNAELAKDRPAVAGARAKSQALASEAALLRQKLIDTAARIQTLEREQSLLADQIDQLQAQDQALADGFARDRISVTRLLAILERLQHDMPPALAVRPDDALAAARGAMLVGASLPPVYAEAAALARRIEQLKSTRAALSG